VVLACTHQRALDFVPIDWLQASAKAS